MFIYFFHFLKIDNENSFFIIYIFLSNEIKDVYIFLFLISWNIQYNIFLLYCTLLSINNIFQEKYHN